MSDSDKIEVARLSELPEGSCKLLCAGKQSILVCNSGGTIYAVANECSHAYQELADGRFGGGWIACPAHGSRFDLATGVPLNPPATEPIATFPVEIEDDRVFVDVSSIA